MSQVKLTKQKRSCSECDRGKRCVIHYQTLKTSENNQITLINDQSYRKLIECKEIRLKMDDGNIHLEQCQSIPVPTYNPKRDGYHRPCYKKFTKAASLCKIKPQKSSDIPTYQLSKSTSTESSRMLFPNKCAICNQLVEASEAKKQYPTLIITTTAEARLKQAAKRKNDQMMLRKIQFEDLIAKEFKKQKSCFREYTCILDRDTDSDDNNDGNEDSEASTDGFSQVCKVVERSILGSHQAISMATLHEIYGAGVGDACYRLKLKERIIWQYGDTLMFINVQYHKPQVVIDANVLSEGATASELLKVEDDYIVKQAAKILRHTVFDFTMATKCRILAGCGTPTT